MDTFSFLKHWRRSGDIAAPLFTTKDTPDYSFSSDTTATVATAVTASSSSDSQDQDDDGAFFDLEFALPEDDSDSDVVSTEKITTAAEGKNQEIVVNLAPDDSINEGDDEVRVVEYSESNLKRDLCNTMMESSSEEANTKIHASAVLKSATKFGVLLFKLKKCKSNVNEKPCKSQVGEEKTHREKNSHQQEQKQQNKFFAVKLKAEEVPFLSLFTRDFSSKGENKRNNVHVVENVDSNQCSTSPDRKIGKDVVNKYLKKVKPLYIRVSKRYGDKLGMSVDLPEPEKSVSPKSGMETSPVVSGVGVEVKSVKQDLQAGLRSVYKQLGKSQLAITVSTAAPAMSNRRDDSLMQQEDGIQSAILHCKRSFNASRDLQASIMCTGNANEMKEKGTVSFQWEDSSSTHNDKGTWKCRPPGPGTGAAAG